MVDPTTTGTDAMNPEQAIPRNVAEQYAVGDPHLRSMIDKGIPLTRNAYLMGAYGGDMPEPWTHEHEAELPECFRDPAAVRARPLPPGASLHQD
jgi:hypothetical protein